METIYEKTEKLAVLIYKLEKLGKTSMKRLIENHYPTFIHHKDDFIKVYVEVIELAALNQIIVDFTITGNELDSCEYPKNHPKIEMTLFNQYFKCFDK